MAARACFGAACFRRSSARACFCAAGARLLEPALASVRSLGIVKGILLLLVGIEDSLADPWVCTLPWNSEGDSVTYNWNRGFSR